MNVSRRYNLVEVILALGVVAIGVVSIMALFPIFGIVVMSLIIHILKKESKA